MEFNPDGSIKLPDNVAKKNSQNRNRLEAQRCIKVLKEVVSVKAPKKCKLNISISQAITDFRFVENIHKLFSQNSSVPSKLVKINDREYEVEIGTDFRSCSDCCSLVAKYREFLDGNLIEDKGSCPYEGRKFGRGGSGFSYEDYFD